MFEKQSRRFLALEKTAAFVLLFYTPE